ncbi:MAG TPA: hypothetical protein VGC56_04445 [Allosphingosinicella sp.]|jgi:hypothetical protein
MNAPDVDTVAAALSSQNPPTPWQIVFLRIVALVGLAVANFYGWIMIRAGFVNTQYLPDNGLFPTPLVAAIVAAFVQLGIFGIYFAIPYLRFAGIVTRLLLPLSWAVLFSLGMILSFYSITLSSDKGRVFSFETGQLGALNKRIVSLDDSISKNFAGFVSRQEELRDAACNGKDQSGIRYCGRISRSYAQRHNDAIDLYGSSFQPVSFDSIGKEVGVFEAWTLIEGNLAKVAPKVDAFKSFARWGHLQSTVSANEFEAIKRESSSYGQKFDGRAPDARSLVLQRTFDNLRAVVRRNASADVYTGAIISILPDVMSVVFALLLTVCAAVEAGGGLQKAIRDTESRTRLLRQWWMSLRAHFREQMRAWEESIKVDTAKPFSDPK